MCESSQAKNICPYVSIIIPTYNHARFLLEALESVIQQSYDNWEAIVVDNHSIDNTVEVVNSFADSRIKFTKVNNEGVIAVSRNIGINMAKGKWIAFLDSDDYWHKDKLSMCLVFENNSDFIFHDMNILRNTKYTFKNKKLKGRSLNKPIIQDLLVNGNPIANSSVLVKNDLLGRIEGINENTNVKGCEDYNTWLRISRISEKFTYIAKPLGTYREHEDNFSKKDMSNAQMNAISEFSGIVSEYDFKKAVSYVLYSKLRYSFIHEEHLISLSDVAGVFKCLNNELRIKVVYMFLVSLVRRLTLFSNKFVADGKKK
ncbi:MAG: glycosyltransferase [Gammaproteobacteria bacterium]|nr:glycosyltransferase [Gammaproteobacteria bacterium]